MTWVVAGFNPEDGSSDDDLVQVEFDLDEIIRQRLRVLLGLPEDDPVIDDYKLNDDEMRELVKMFNLDLPAQPLEYIIGFERR